MAPLQPFRESDLGKLTHRLQDLAPLPPSHELDRWMVAYDGHLDTAEHNFRQSMAWREQKGTDYILRWKPPEILRQYYPGGCAGFDKEDCPVWIIPFGRADMKGILNCVSREEFVDFTIRIVETSLDLMRQRSEATGTPVTQHVFVFDLMGFTLGAATHGPTLDILQRLMAVYEANYPETLKAAYVINASTVFQIIFRIVKGTVQTKTLNKIKVFGSSDWREPLVAALGEEVLPPLWGGVNTKTGNICMGGEVTLQQKNIFSSVNSGDISKDKKASSVNVAPGSSYTLRYTFSQSTHLQYKFKTEGGDIGFCIERIPGVDRESPSNRDSTKVKQVDNCSEDISAETEVVVRMYKAKSHKELQTGYRHCEAGFTYLFTFDNKHSMFTSKILHFVMEQQTGENMEEAEETTLIGVRSPANMD